MAVADKLNELVIQRNNLADNLNTMGVSATQDETFTSLVPKVLDIETGITPTGTIEITENGTYDVSDKASANVNVSAGLSEYFMESATSIKTLIKKIPMFTITGSTMASFFEGCSSLITIPQLDTSNVTDMSNMFKGCNSLTTIPQLDTSKVTNMGYMFYYCSNLTTIQQLDTSKVTNMGYMCYGCEKLQSIQQLNTSNVTNLSYAFLFCYALTSLPLLDTQNVTNMSFMLYQCISLESIPQLNAQKVTNVNNMLNGLAKLTTLGGFQNLGQAYSTTQSANYSNYALDVSTCKLLTHDSLMNVINNLYDIATKGCNTQKLILGSKNLAKLTPEEIAIATSKGFSVS